MSILEIRKTTDMTQKTFSGFLNIPLRTLQGWELGERKCPEYVTELIKFKVKKEVLNMNTMYVMEYRYGVNGDESVYFFDTKEKAVEEATERWNYLCDADKKRTSITVGRCDTCHINEDGNWDYMERDGYALCDLQEIYLELSI